MAAVGMGPISADALARAIPNPQRYAVCKTGTGAGWLLRGTGTAEVEKGTPGNLASRCDRQQVQVTDTGQTESCAAGRRYTPWQRPGCRCREEGIPPTTTPACSCPCDQALPIPASPNYTAEPPTPPCCPPQQMMAASLSECSPRQPHSVLHEDYTGTQPVHPPASMALQNGRPGKMRSLVHDQVPTPPTPMSITRSLQYPADLGVYVKSRSPPGRPRWSGTVPVGSHGPRGATGHPPGT